MLVWELAPRPMVKLFSLIEQIEILMYKLINFSKQAFFSEPTSICFPKSYMGQNTQNSFPYSHKNIFIPSLTLNQAFAVDLVNKTKTILGLTSYSGK